MDKKYLDRLLRKRGQIEDEIERISKPSAFDIALKELPVKMKKAFQDALGDDAEMTTPREKLVSELREDAKYFLGQANHAERTDHYDAAQIWTERGERASHAANLIERHARTAPASDGGELQEIIADLHSVASLKFLAKSVRANLNKAAAALDERHGNEARTASASKGGVAKVEYGRPDPKTSSATFLPWYQTHQPPHCPTCRCGDEEQEEPCQTKP